MRKRDRGKKETEKEKQRGRESKRDPGTSGNCLALLNQGRARALWGLVLHASTPEVSADLFSGICHAFREISEDEFQACTLDHIKFATESSVLPTQQPWKWALPLNSPREGIGT